MSERRMLYFVHIPKTAGTSFRLAMERDPSFHMLYDYGWESTASTPELLAQEAKGAKDLDAVAASDRINVICGHVHFRKYARYVPAGNVLSIVRNPVERLVSEYQHLVRNEHYGQSFSEYLATPHEIDKQWKMLDGVDLHAGGLFGLASHHDAFLGLVRQRFAVSLDSLVCNQAPGVDRDRRQAIAADEVALAFRLNDRDLGRFFEVAGVFIRTLRRSGVRTIPPRRARFNCTVDGQRQLVGWVSRMPGDCLFVKLSVNGQPRAIVNPNAQRPDVVAKGLSAMERCGFSYPLALLGVQENDQVEMAIIGAETLQKSIHFRSGSGQ